MEKTLYQTIKEISRGIRHLAVTNFENKIIFKDHDLGFLSEFKDFLNEHDIMPTIGGGMRKNIFKGNFREYKDIDLRVVPKEKDVYEEFKAPIRCLYQASNEGKKISNWTVEDESEAYARYVGVDVEYKFRIKSPKTQTSIDITFGRHDKDKTGDLRGEENIPTSISCPALMIFTKIQRKK